MKFVLIIVATLPLLACSPENAQRLPTAPGVLAPRPTSASVWAMVIDEFGICIVDATVEVVRGQGAGQQQITETPCGRWDYHGGAVFKDLTPDVEITLRASAPGYAAQEKTVVPSNRAIFFELTRIR